MTARKKPASKSKAVAKWDEQLAQYAEQAAGMESNSAGGNFFGLQGGILTWQDAPLPDNQMLVVILDSIFENVYYESEYDPDTPQGPTCFAFGRDEKEMEPHVIVKEAEQDQSPSCSECEWNEFGSAERGRGKACRNTRRLAMIPAGQFDKNGDAEIIEEIDHFETATAGFMKLPVTSIKGYANFVRQVAGALKRPPFGIVTKVSVVPDPKTQFKVVFEPYDKLGDEYLEVIMDRVEEVKSTIDFPYQLDEEEPEPKPKPRRGRAAAKKKPAAKKKKAPARRRKY